MDPLTAIASANAAYKTIRACIKNGGELASVAKHIGRWIEGEEVARERVEKKKNSLFGSRKTASDLEEFLHLQKVGEQRRELESYMRLYARPGTYNAWVTFQANARKKRKAEKLARAKARRKLIEVIAIVIAALALIATIALGAWLVLAGENPPLADGKGFNIFTSDLD